MFVELKIITGNKDERIRMAIKKSPTYHMLQNAVPKSSNPGVTVTTQNSFSEEAHPVTYISTRKALESIAITISWVFNCN